MPWEAGLEKALSQLSQQSPFVLAARSGCHYEGTSFRLPFFNRNLLVSFPQGEVQEEGKASPPWLRLLILHYLLTADGTPVADSWITYRHLPGAQLFAGRFQSLAIAPLIRAFGHDLEGFRRAGLALGGMPLTRTGDAGFRFLALPYLPMACLLYLGDEEVPPSLSILFDAHAPHYLHTEDLSYLGGYLSNALRSHK